MAINGNAWVAVFTNWELWC